MPGMRREFLSASSALAAASILAVVLALTRMSFSFKLRSGVVEGQAITNAQGYAHFHQKLTPSMAPSGKKVEVGVSAIHDGVTMSASTWFTPHYD